MKTEGKTVTRAELYAEIWRTPLYKLAQSWGVTSAGITQACETLNVPRPDQGYWPRLKLGQSVQPDPLPELPAGSGESITISFPGTRRSEPTQTANDLQNKAKAEPAAAVPSPTEPRHDVSVDPAVQKDTGHTTKIQVPKTLEGAHKLVRQTQSALTGTDTYLHKGFVHTQGGTEQPLSLQVSPGQVNRALRIMDAVIKAILARGARFERNPRGWGLMLMVGRQPVWFAIREAMKRLNHTFTDEEREAQGFRWKEKYDWVGSGNLRFHVYAEKWVTSVMWEESRTVRLEDHLHEIVDKLANVETEAKQLQAAEAERQKIRAAEDHRQHLLWMEQEREKEQRTLLENVADGWVKARRIAALIRKCEGILSQSGGMAPGGWEERWLKWATEHAKRIDPIGPYLAAQKQRFSSGQ